MSEDKLVHRATQVTWSTLERGLNDPMFLLAMAAHGISPEDIEYRVKKSLEYLDETKDTVQKLLEEETAGDNNSTQEDFKKSEKNKERK